MKNLTITDVRVLPGDSAFLIDNGETAILCDTGFGFTGSALAQKIGDILGGRPLDYLFLTHSHYDHVLGAPHVLRAYPQAKVVAGEYAAKVFERQGARKKMRELDQSFARTCGAERYEDLLDELRVDIAVCDGDLICCGEMVFTAVALPGHTRCSMGFYLESERLLLAAETLGVYFGRDTYMPSYLVSYQQTLESFARAKRLGAEKILVPHYGLVEGAADFLCHSEQASMAFAKALREIIDAGGSDEDALDYCRKHIYKEHVRGTYPIDAFLLNSSIMIGLIRKEAAV